MLSYSAKPQRANGPPPPRLINTDTKRELVLQWHVRQFTRLPRYFPQPKGGCLAVDFLDNFVNSVAFCVFRFWQSGCATCATLFTTFSLKLAQLHQGAAVHWRQWCCSLCLGCPPQHGANHLPMSGPKLPFSDPLPELVSDQPCIARTKSADVLSSQFALYRPRVPKWRPCLPSPPQQVQLAAWDAQSCVLCPKCTV